LIHNARTPSCPPNGALGYQSELFLDKKALFSAYPEFVSFQNKSFTQNVMLPVESQA